MMVPIATAELISSIRVVSKSPRLADPSRTTTMKMIMKQRLDAMNGSQHVSPAVLQVKKEQIDDYLLPQGACSNRL